MSRDVEVKIGEITRISERGGDFYRVTGETKDGKRGSVEIPTHTLDHMSKSEGEKLMKRGILGTAAEK